MKHSAPDTPRFSLGKTVITANATSTLSNEDILISLRRHHSGDWGDVGKEDWKENELSIRKGLRLVSAYYSTDRIRFWIITEADRSVTTVLLPEDY